jgi:hypothetical protein
MRNNWIVVASASGYAGLLRYGCPQTAVAIASVQRTRASSTPLDSTSRRLDHRVLGQWRTIR